MLLAVDQLKLLTIFVSGFFLAEKTFMILKYFWTLSLTCIFLPLKGLILEIISLELRRLAISYDGRSLDLKEF